MKKLIALLLAAVLAVSCFSGCGTIGTVIGKDETPEEFVARNEEKDNSVVVILGNHANAVKPTEEMIWDTLYPVLKNAVTFSYDEEEEDYKAKINLSVIISDGDPDRVELMEVGKKKDGEENAEPAEPVKLSCSAATISRLEKLLEYSMEDIKEAIVSDDLMADDAEVDLVAAMNMAVNILRENPGRENHIVIFDTGITTAGYLDMRLLDIQRDTAQEVLDDMQPSCFVELKDIYVTFTGLGNTCGSQIDFHKDNLVTKRLVEFWTGYFEKCEATMLSELVISEAMGTALLYNEDGNNTESDQKTWPEVSNVPFKISTVDIDNGEDHSGTPAPEPKPDVIVLNTTSLKFKGDSAEFRDREAAEQTLMSYEDTFAILKANPEITIYVVGSTAKTTPSEEVKKDTPLGESRAAVVKDLICSLYQIDEAQVVVVNAGTQEFSWRNAKEFTSSSWNSLDRNAQQANRVVAIIPSTADQYQELVAAGEV